MGMRRKAREIVVQTLYSLNFVETDSYLGSLELLNNFKTFLDNIAVQNEIEEDNPIYKFAEVLITGILKNMDEIDEIISSHSLNWDFSRIAVLDKEILRIAVYEIKYSNTPPAIIMDEAIEISKKYCAENSSKFINGILNTIAKENGMTNDSINM